LYQIMLGAWPLNPAEEIAFIERLVAFMQKALREAKVHTSWINPVANYESAVESFIRNSVALDGRSRFMEDFLELRKTVAAYGCLNALSQTLLKIMSPGIPDFYQGTELWDFSLVDPDNRRPVDFQERVRLLDELQSREREGLEELLKDLISNWQDGRIKLYLVRKALNFRIAHKELVAAGDYIPLEGAGQRSGHLVAFARRRRKQWIIVAVPRLVAGLQRGKKSFLPGRSWPALDIVLPSECPSKWRNLFTNGTASSKQVASGQRIIPLSRMFENFPAILLEPALD
jgi:(1->4)-alpha-D-glucan 1-alpha-D-glucosylmutase